MPNTWPINLDNGKTWYVGSYVVPVFPMRKGEVDSDAQVIIPIEQLEGMSNEEIGETVRSAVELAIWCNTEELAYNYLRGHPSYHDDNFEARLRELEQLFKRFSDRSEHLREALSQIEGDKNDLEQRKKRAVKKAEEEARKNAPDPGYVYLIKAETGIYKIGRTTQLNQRITRFETNLPLAIELIHTINCQYHKRAEKHLHAKYAEKRIQGTEWFNLAPEQVEEIKAIQSM